MGIGTSSGAARGPRPATEHKREQIVLHRRLAGAYAHRHAPPFAAAFHRYWNEELINALGPLTGPVLDCGCGTGVLLADLRDRYRQVHGLDLSWEMLAGARRAGTASGLAVADGERLPYADASFAGVVCRSALHHMPDPARALAEIRRVLRPGGRLVASEPSNDFWPVYAARKLMYAVSDHFSPDDRAYLANAFCQQLEAVGFQVRGWRRFGYASYILAGFPDVLPLLRYVPFALPLTQLCIRLDRALARWPAFPIAGLHFIVTADAAPAQ